MEITNILYSESLDSLRQKPLLVMLHGWGAKNSDIYLSADPFLDDFVVAAPEAPNPVDTSLYPGYEWVKGYEWYEIRDYLIQPQKDMPHPNYLDRGQKAANIVLNWLKPLHKQYPDAPIFLFGFSQGASMTLEILRAGGVPIKATACVSGFVLEDALNKDETLKKPNVFYARDNQDTVINPVRSKAALEWLQKYSSLTEKNYPGIDHSIIPEELEDIKNYFLSFL